MKKHASVTTLVLFAVILFTQCATQPKGEDIVLTNTSSVNLTDKAISVERSEIPGYAKGALERLRKWVWFNDKKKLVSFLSDKYSFCLF